MLGFRPGLSFGLQLHVYDGDDEGEVLGQDGRVRVRFRAQCRVRIGLG